jgi:pimeloyl-ACP methyl ester carboxylesterase
MMTFSQHKKQGAVTRLLATAALTMAVTTSMPTAQAAGEAAVEAPGRMVDLGTHRLHLLCEGSGEPTVVIDSGLGALSMEWRSVQGALATRFRTCLYDRAGYGWSDPGPLPRTTERIAGELDLLLERAQEAGPFVLVGHSFGGYTAQMYARRFPERTAGIVLVDASHPGQVRRFLDSPLRLNTAPSRKQGQVMYSGITVHEGLPPEVREAVFAVGFTPKARMAMTQEFLWFRESAQQVADAGPMPDRPMVVLTRGRAEPDASDAVAAANRHLFEQIWLQLQHELAESAPHAAHLVAERSGHQMHIDQPEVVADAISMVADFATADSALVDQPAERPRGWLAFRNATWQVDHLHAGMGLDRTPSVELPATLEAAVSGAGRPVRARHFIGSPRPQYQQVVYFEGER